MKTPASTTRTAVVSASLVNSSESRATAANSETEAAAIASCPSRLESCRPSRSTGVTSASDVADSKIAASSGLSTRPTASRPKPTTSPAASTKTKPSNAARSNGPRSWCRSSSKPARNSTKASPRSATTCTGSSISAHPRTSGPMSTPSRISITATGTLTEWIRSTTMGAAKAATVTTTRLSKVMSVMWGCRRPVADLPRLPWSTVPRVSSSGPTCEPRCVSMPHRRAWRNRQTRRV